MARLAGRARREGDAQAVHAQHKRLTPNIGESHIERVGETLFSGSIQPRLRNQIPDTSLEPISKFNQLTASIKSSTGNLARSSQTDDSRHVVRAGAKASFLPATVDLRGKAHAPAHVQCADALRTVHLVR